MRFDLLAYLPSRISCQIVALVIVSLLASHIVLTILFFLHLHEKPPGSLREPARDCYRVNRYHSV